MKTILVPTDFSSTAKNAAIYAIKLATSLSAEKIILFNAYQPVAPIVNEPTLPATSLPVIDVQTMQQISSNNLLKFKNDLIAEQPSTISIDLKSDFSNLANDINDICETTGADLIVMGVTGTSKIEEMLIGSTAISVVKSTKVPVIIVPPGATYSPIKNIVFACDLKKVAETTPVNSIKTIVDLTSASLHILNVNEGNQENEAQKNSQSELLGSMLQECNPVFHFVDDSDFVTGINSFSDQNSIDLIIMIPKRHDFFDGLFKESHSRRLAFHSHVPLMCIHQEDL